VDELATVADDDFCYLTTRGRVSGRPHEIEIWFALDDRTLYLLSGGGDRSDWMRNLRADPAVTVRLRDTPYAATARIVEPGEESQRARGSSSTSTSRATAAASSGGDANRSWSPSMYIADGDADDHRGRREPGKRERDDLHPRDTVLSRHGVRRGPHGAA
jgi:deazaflavin-dependent oxidoreductase (nitroreductase family)